MRISVNLANRPFIELRPLFAKLRLAMVVLALLAVGLGFALHSLNAKARVAQAQMDALNARRRAAQVDYTRARKQATDRVTAARATYKQAGGTA